MSAPPISGYFFDNNLSPYLASGMRTFGEDVCHLTDLFPRDTKDPVWLPEIGARGLILVSHDTKIRKKPIEIALVKQHLVGGFFLINKEGGGHTAGRCAIIEQLVRHWRLMKREAAARPRPFLFAVSRFGTKLTPYF